MSDWPAPNSISMTSDVRVVFFVVLHEVEAVLHGQQVTRSVMACRGSARSAHSGTAAGRSRSMRPSPTSRPRDRVEERLGHRPAEQRRVGVDRRRRAVEVFERTGVPLGDDGAAVHDDHRERRCQRALLVEHLVEQRGEGVDALGHRGLGPACSAGQGTSGRWRGRRHQVRVWGRPLTTGPFMGSRRLRPGRTATPRSSPQGAPVGPSARRPRRRWRRGSPAVTSGAASTAPGIMKFTGSSDPVMKPVGMV